VPQQTCRARGAVFVSRKGGGAAPERDDKDQSSAGGSSRGAISRKRRTIPGGLGEPTTPACPIAAGPICRAAATCSAAAAAAAAVVEPVFADTLRARELRSPSAPSPAWRPAARPCPKAAVFCWSAHASKRGGVSTPLLRAETRFNKMGQHVGGLSMYLSLGV
jgi:hypothetical protein